MLTPVILVSSDLCFFVYDRALFLDWRQLNEIDAEKAPVFAVHESEQPHHSCKPVLLFFASSFFFQMLLL